MEVMPKVFNVSVKFVKHLGDVNFIHESQITAPPNVTVSQSVFLSVNGELNNEQYDALLSDKDKRK
jgi:hypothetical protein